MGSGPPHLDQKKPRRRTSAGLLFDCLSHDTQSLAGFICAVDTTGTLAGVGLCRSSSMSWNTEARALGGSPRSTWLARSACAAAWSKPHHRNGAVRLRRAVSIEAVRPRFPPLQGPADECEVGAISTG